MIPARAVSPPLSPLVHPLRLNMLSYENGDPQIKINSLENNQKLPNTRRGWWGFLRAYWNVAKQIPASLTPRTIVAQMRCSPRSYSHEMDEMYRRYSDPRIFKAYLTKALDTIPLEILQTSVYFWGDANFSLICTLLADKPVQFRQLLEITPPDKYNYYPGHCTTETQIKILLDHAFDHKEKLQQITDIILTMIGEPRNGIELDNFYYFYLNQLIQRQGSDAYVAARLRLCKASLALEQINALKKIENAPLLSEALQEIKAKL